MGGIDENEVVVLAEEEAWMRLQTLNQTKDGIAPVVEQTEIVGRLSPAVGSRVFVFLHDSHSLESAVKTIDTWDIKAISSQLGSTDDAFAIRTNAAQYPNDEAQILIRTICRTVRRAAARIRKDVEIIVVSHSSIQTAINVIESTGGRRSPPMQYQRLGNSGLKVSKLILGCMSFGNPQWEGSPWILPEEKALPLLKKAYDMGINTWETADTYSNGQSETIIGKALSTYKIPRSKVVIMSKLYYPVLQDNPNSRPQPAINNGPLVNQMGLSRKHIFEAVEGSLRRLNTSYIDLLQLHRLDRDTSPEEIMCALHDLVRMGKVHYLGASSMYCWEFARLQYVARVNGWTTFSSMSGLYNLLYREEEREMVPFCDAEGIGFIPWSPIARGLLTRPWTEETDRSKQDVKAKKWFQGDQNQQIVVRVEQIALQKTCSMSSIALAWLLRQGTCPIVGLNSVERIENVTEAFSVHLSDEEVLYLEGPYRPLEVQAM